MSLQRPVHGGQWRPGADFINYLNPPQVNRKRFVVDSDVVRSVRLVRSVHSVQSTTFQVQHFYSHTFKVVRDLIRKCLFEIFSSESPLIIVSVTVKDHISWSFKDD